MKPLGRLTLLAVMATSSLLFAKGYGGGQLSDAPEAASLLQATESYAQVVKPTNVQCADRDFRYTRAGELALRDALNGGDTCHEACARNAPTAQKCMDEAFLNSICGQIEMANIHAVTALLPDGGHPARCPQLIKNSGVDAGLDQYSSKEVLVPGTLSKIADGGELSMVMDGGLRATVRSVPFNRDSLTFEGMDTTVWGQTMKDYATFGKTHVSLSDIALRNTIRNEWNTNDNNGCAVDSCREYIYEKYFDWSRFEDAMATHAGDYRAIYNLAYSTQADGGHPPGAIGTAGLRGEPLLNRCGDPLPESVKFPKELQPKNTFFSVPYLVEVKNMFGQVTATREQLLQEEYPPDMGRPVLLFVNQTVIMDDELHQTLVDGEAHRFQETWAWHKHKSDILAPRFLDEELYAYDILKDEFRELLYHRTMVWQAFMDYWNRHANKLRHVREFQQFLRGEEVINPSWDETTAFLEKQKAAKDERWRRLTGITDTFKPFAVVGVADHAAQLPGQQLLNLSQSAKSGVTRLANQNLINAPSPYNQPQEHADFPGLEVDTGGGLSFVGTGEVVPCAGRKSMIEKYACRLAWIDNAIEATLKRARDLGCLDLVDANGCDWSPRRFLDGIYDPFSMEREPAFQRCQEHTSRDVFAHIKDAPESFKVNGEGVEVEYAGQLRDCSNFPSPRDYRWRGDYVDLYSDCWDLWFATTIKEVMKALSGGGAVIGPGYIGKQSGESMQLGNRMFGANMGYSFGWKLSQLTEDNVDMLGSVGSPCNLGVSANGALYADVTALYVRQELIDAWGYFYLQDENPNNTDAENPYIPDGLNNNSARAHLEILGKTVWDPEPAGEGMSPTIFNVVTADNSISETFFETSYTFVVVIIPVSVGGGVAGRLGVSISLVGGTMDNGKGSCEQGNLGFTGTLTPYAAIDAWAFASVDALVVEAGVKINLTLIRVDLPFTNNVLYGIMEGGSELGFNVSSNLDLVVTVLSGSLLAFVEVCYIVDCSYWEEELFSWNGPSFRVNLFESKFNASLLPVAIWLQNPPGGSQ